MATAVNRLITHGRVAWFELFYDLVVVAALMSMNGLVVEGPSFSTVLLALLAATGMFTLWLLTTLALNRFPGEQPVRSVLVLAQMALVVLAALAVDQARGLRSDLGLIAFALALLTVAGLYWVCPRVTGPTPDGTSFAVVGLVSASAVVLAAAAIGPAAVRPALLLAMVLALVPVATAYARRVDDRHPIDPAHLAERMGLLVLIAIGLGISELVVDLAGFPDVPDARFFALTFVAMFLLWWLYFGLHLDASPPGTTVRRRLWIGAHFLLFVGIIGIGDVFTGIGTYLPDEQVALWMPYLGLLLAITLCGYAIIAAMVPGLGARAPGCWSRSRR